MSPEDRELLEEMRKEYLEKFRECERLYDLRRRKDPDEELDVNRLRLSHHT